jgi:hypothetical protein
VTLREDERKGIKEQTKFWHKVIVVRNTKIFAFANNLYAGSVFHMPGGSRLPPWV